MIWCKICYPGKKISSVIRILRQEEKWIQMIVCEVLPIQVICISKFLCCSTKCCWFYQHIFQKEFADAIDHGEVLIQDIDGVCPKVTLDGSIIISELVYFVGIGLERLHQRGCLLGKTVKRSHKYLCIIPFFPWLQVVKFPFIWRHRFWWPKVY